MAIIRDPEGNEIRALETLIDENAGKVLEIGCGDGRLTWRYADKVGQIIAIDPKTESIEKARAQLPSNLAGKVKFFETTLDNFYETHRESNFNLVIFSWSL